MTPPRIWIAKEIDLAAKVKARLHEIPIKTVNDIAFYQEVVSLNAFRSGALSGKISEYNIARNRTTCCWDHGRNVLYRLNTLEEFVVETNSIIESLSKVVTQDIVSREYWRAKPGMRPEEIPRIEHATIWDFYKFIGFNNKQRCYNLPK